MQEKLKTQRQPNFISPQLATLKDKCFSSSNWIYEEKFDGIRCIAVKKANRVILYSRNQNVLNSNYPTLVKILEKQKIKNFIIDAEIVAFDGKVTSFSKLQRAKKEKIDVYMYAFDLLYLDKFNLTNQELEVRKKLLKKYFKFTDKFRYTKHIEKEGEKCFKKACQRGLEGIIAKRKDSKYLSKRTANWLKFKCFKRQEFIILGYTDPKGGRIGFGSLLLGYFENKKIKFAGKVGTGFDFSFLKSFILQLKKIESKSPYFSSLVKIKNAHFVRPKYVAEIAFAEWTDSKLRQPRFLGLRFDKPYKKVIKETAN